MSILDIARFAGGPKRDREGRIILPEEIYVLVSSPRETGEYYTFSIGPLKGQTIPKWEEYGNYLVRINNRYVNIDLYNRIMMNRSIIESMEMLDEGLAKKVLEKATNMALINYYTVKGEPIPYDYIVQRIPGGDLRAPPKTEYYRLLENFKEYVFSVVSEASINQQEALLLLEVLINGQYDLSNLQHSPTDLREMLFNVNVLRDVLDGKVTHSQLMNIPLENITWVNRMRPQINRGEITYEAMQRFDSRVLGDLYDDAFRMINLRLLTYDQCATMDFTTFRLCSSDPGRIALRHGLIDINKPFGFTPLISNLWTLLLRLKEGLLSQECTDIMIAEADTWALRRLPTRPRTHIPCKLVRLIQAGYCTMNEVDEGRLESLIRGFPIFWEGRPLIKYLIGMTKSQVDICMSPSIIMRLVTSPDILNIIRSLSDEKCDRMERRSNVDLWNFPNYIIGINEDKIPYLDNPMILIALIHNILTPSIINRMDLLLLENMTPEVLLGLEKNSLSIDTLLHITHPDLLDMRLLEYDSSFINLDPMKINILVLHMEYTDHLLRTGLLTYNKITNMTYDELYIALSWFGMYILEIKPNPADWPFNITHLENEAGLIILKNNSKMDIEKMGERVGDWVGLNILWETAEVVYSPRGREAFLRGRNLEEKTLEEILLILEEEDL